MADIKTHLRELSVATTVGLLKSGLNFNQTDLFDNKTFFDYATKVVDNDITIANDILSLDYFDEDLKTIIQNGYRLGYKIYSSPQFKICKEDKIIWIGSDTQKGNPFDLEIGEYKFSLKEESFILKNMGLYQLLNNLIGSSYARGLHVFSDFALAEYDAWFKYTWNNLVQELSQGKTWTHINGQNISKIYLDGTGSVALFYNDRVSYVPINITTNAEYMRHTVSITREKVFAKWISEKISNDEKYIHLKKECSLAAGKKISDTINKEYVPDNIYDFFQIYPTDYYYAKTTSSETTILKVPSRKNFKSNIEFIGSAYSVPLSQLNIISTFQNIKTKETLEFRNECRFSHGQFNGTPEAKMYVGRNTSLTNLYDPIEKS